MLIVEIGGVAEQRMGDTFNGQSELWVELHYTKSRF